jgi:hypothetical protein
MEYDRPKKVWSWFINGLLAPVNILNHSHKGIDHALVFSLKLFLVKEKSYKRLLLFPHILVL